MKKKSGLFLMLMALLLIANAVIPAVSFAAGSVSISTYVTYSGGYATVSWTASGNAPSSYLVYAKVDNSSSEQAMIKLGETKRNSIQTSDLAPGTRYTVFVTDPEYNILGSETVMVPYVDTFVDGKLKNTSIKVSLETRKYDLSTQKYKRVNSLSAKEIISGFESNSAYYGVKYQMRMPQLAYERSFFVTLVFESPNGFLEVERATDVTFDRVNNGYQTIWWELTGTAYFYDLYNTVGEIPAGTYTIHMYWDGMWVSDTTFKVGK